jgi:hypothetical protein
MSVSSWYIRASEANSGCCRRLGGTDLSVTLRFLYTKVGKQTRTVKPENCYFVAFWPSIARVSVEG